MVKEAGVFDYFDRSPPDEEFRDLLRAAERYDPRQIAIRGCRSAKEAGPSPPRRPACLAARPPPVEPQPG
jgi:hypothetical protein